MLAARALDADGEERHLGVADDERAVRAAADVMAAAEVGELVSLRGRDEDVAGIRVRERSPGAGERIGVIEDRGIAARA